MLTSSVYSVETTTIKVNNRTEVNEPVDEPNEIIEEEIENDSGFETSDSDKQDDLVDESNNDNEENNVVDESSKDDKEENLIEEASKMQNSNIDNNNIGSEFNILGQIKRN